MDAQLGLEWLRGCHRHFGGGTRFETAVKQCLTSIQSDLYVAVLVDIMISTRIPLRADGLASECVVSDAVTHFQIQLAPLLCDETEITKRRMYFIQISSYACDIESVIDKHIDKAAVKVEKGKDAQEKNVA